MRLAKLCEDIAKELGITEGTVSWYCLTHAVDLPWQKPIGVPVRNVYQRGDRPVRPYTSEEDRSLLQMERKGASAVEIGRKISRRWNSVRGRLATLARREERQAASEFPL